ncbi:DUF5723 family protein [Mucilaginibacter sp.]|uniref:DUF5723 family protein n=1 Tax=Mucilaginibacter sp. TaxID=1882438 RepID=UPI00261259B9|nr:DUF5723 family protein [Mucilaginibacter sp.]MDB5032254.1 hypothetical protein [Mucilaginibacter sp.]
MKKGLLIWCFFLLTVKVFGQQYSQYNTGSLYESFENPSVRTFIPDTSKNFSFNFLIPNFNANFYLTGNAQEALKTRAFSSYYNTAGLQIGKGQNNHLYLNANVYSVMFKMFSSANGNQEVGFFVNTKTEASGVASDESVALFNGYSNFPNNTYNNIFNGNIYYQVYHQIGVTYREQVSKRLAIGIKFSALSGLSYKKYSIDKSSITFDKANDAATLSLQGTGYSNGTAGQSGIRSIIPTFLNPGAAITLGASYVDESGYTWQGNIKDVGFIHWNSTSSISSFNTSKQITGLSSSDRENNVITQADSVTSSGQVKKSFTSKTNGLLELSINKTYWLDGEQQIKFSPTLIASKEMFYPGFTAALVTPVQLGNYIISLTSSYNDLKLFNFGGQFMIKKYDSEFFIGSERLFQTISLIKNAAQSTASTTQPQFVTSQGAYSGMDFYIGVSFKFGSIIESRMNESSTPNGDKGFIGKIWEKLFHKDKNY